MNITDLLSSLRTGQTAPGGESISYDKIQNAQKLSNLTPGQIVRGEVVASDGQNVTLKLDGDVYVDAKLDLGVSLEQGRQLSLEVRSNGGTLSLTPLYTNLSAQDPVANALKAAGIGLTDRSIAMTEEMMGRGMSVDVSSLQSMYKEVNMFRQAGVSDLVELRALGVPANADSLAQIENYKSLSHELVKGLSNVTAELYTEYSSIEAQIGEDGALKLFQQITSALMDSEIAGGYAESVTDGGALQQAELQSEGEQASEVMSETSADNAEVQYADANSPATTDAGPGNGTSVDSFPVSSDTQVAGTAEDKIAMLIKQAQDAVAKASGEAAAEEAKDTVLQQEPQVLSEPDEAKAVMQLADRLTTLNQNGDIHLPKDTTNIQNEKELLQLLSEAKPQTREGKEFLREFFTGKEGKTILDKAISGQYTLKPDEVIKEQVRSLYARLQNQLGEVSKLLENAGLKDSHTQTAVSNMEQNVDFLNQINQAFTYVQLPLQMTGQNATGDLYVFTNKKSLASADGNVTALLHLNMDHLGPLDVYISMSAGEHVNTRFTVADDDVLDFLNDHMDLLTSRLEGRGYTLKTEMSVREKSTEESNPVEILLGKKNAGGDILIGQSSFDFRA